jgi:hypothetical protein
MGQRLLTVWGEMRRLSGTLRSQFLRQKTLDSLYTPQDSCSLSLDVSLLSK